jgi:hypothetical protein
MTFRVGQKVVCVDDHDQPSAPYVVQGRIYTISGLHYCHDGLGFYLEEVPDIETDDYWGSFKAERFRPIVSRKTDISALKALLVPGAKIRETA